MLYLFEAFIKRIIDDEDLPMNSSVQQFNNSNRCHFSSFLLWFVVAICNVYQNNFIFEQMNEIRCRVHQNVFILCETVCIQYLV